MPAGLQTFTPDGYSQISSDDIVFSLLAKGTLTPSTSWTYENTPYVNATRYTEITIPEGNQNTDGILAVHSPDGAWSYLLEASASSVTYGVAGAAGDSDIEWYYFSRGRPPSNPSGSGLEVYDSSGGIIFASDFPPLKPLGMINQDGYTGIPSSTAKIAAVPIKRPFSWQISQQAITQGCIPPGGSTPNGYNIQRYTYGETALISCGNGISSVGIVPFFSQTGPINIGCSPSFFTSADGRVGDTWGALLIDVTNYM